LRLAPDGGNDGPVATPGPDATLYDAPLGPIDVDPPTALCSGSNFGANWETGDATQIGNLAGDGGASIQNEIAFVGNWSLRIDTTGGATTGHVVTGQTTKDVYFHQFYFRADLLPASGHDPIFISDSGGTDLDADSVEIRIDSSGYLSVYQRDTGEATPNQWQPMGDMATERPGQNLITETWYLIEIEIDQDGPAYALRVNAETMLSGALTDGISPQDRYAWGKYTDISGDPVIFYYDEVVDWAGGWPGGCLYE
jgi:hypothetical protein